MAYLSFKISGMKIALIGPTHPFRGGISHYTTLLYRNLKSRHEVRFFSFKRQYPRWLFPGKSDIDPSKAHIRVAGVERMIDSVNPVTWFRTAQEMIRYDGDLLILPWWVSFWAPQFLVMAWLVKRRSNARILFICHNVVSHESTVLDKLMTRLVLKTGDLFLVHSDEDRNNLLKMMPGAKVCKRFHPSYDVFQMSGFDREACRKQLGVSGNVLLFFGFVREYKGLKYLLAALPRIMEQVPVTLLVVGEFWKDKMMYLDMIREMGIEDRVQVIDEYIPNEDVGLYFCAADLVVQPYVSATGSGVVQVAYGFERPVVATDVGSLPEIVENGRTGYIVPPAKPEAIADAVIAFFKEERAESFCENIRAMQYRFSWEHLVDGIEELVEGRAGSV